MRMKSPTASQTEPFMRPVNMLPLHLPPRGQSTHSFESYGGITASEDIQLQSRQATKSVEFQEIGACFKQHCYENSILDKNEPY